MRKKVTRVKPLVADGHNLNERVVETGIYRESLTWGYGTISTLEDTLATIRENAESVEKESRVELRSIPDEIISVGELQYSRKEEHPAWGKLCTASTALSLLAEVQTALAAGNVRDAANAGIALGRAAEKMSVQKKEHLALIGLRQSRRNSDIAKSRHVSTDEIQRRCCAVQAELLAQSTSGERLSRERAYKAAAEKLDLSKESVKKAFLAHQSEAVG